MIIQLHPPIPAKSLPSTPMGELIRESMEEVGWNVTEEAASRLGCDRGTLSRLLNGRAGMSTNMALALESIGWGTAEHRVRMQVSYELAIGSWRTVAIGDASYLAREEFHPIQPAQSCSVLAKTASRVPQL